MRANGKRTRLYENRCMRQATGCAALQDLLLYAVKGLRSRLKKPGKRHQRWRINAFINKAVFSTLTNVNFDPERFVTLINDCVSYRESLKGRLPRPISQRKAFQADPASYVPATTLSGLVSQGEAVGIKPEDAPMKTSFHFSSCSHTA